MCSNRDFPNILSVLEGFSEESRRLMHSHGPTVISKENVFRPKNLQARELINTLIRKFILSKSCILGQKHLVTLDRYAQQGNSCLILLEHYSNMDFPVLIYLLERSGVLATEISDHIIPMSAMKLNEEHPALSTLTDAYTHISIFPARRIEELAFASHGNAELRRAREINHAALKHMREMAHSGNMILMFPSGTRYRPSDPQTKRVMKAADSFIKRFNYVIFGGIMGSILAVNETNEMISDYVLKDNMIYQFSKVYECKAFRKEIKAQIKDDDDIKQHVAIRIEQELDALHIQAQRTYDKVRGASPAKE